MAVNREHLLKCLKRIRKRAEGPLVETIRTFPIGLYTDDDAWRDWGKLAEVVVRGVAEAGDKMAEEVRSLAGDESPEYAEDVGNSLRGLSGVLMATYSLRKKPPDLDDRAMKIFNHTYKELEEALLLQCKHFINDVQHSGRRARSTIKGKRQ
jgi:hypothetical protein